MLLFKRREIASSLSLCFNPILQKYFGRAPTAKTVKKTSNPLKARALSDDKSAKLSKADEEAEKKNKKAQMENIKKMEEEKKNNPIKNQSINFESKLNDEIRASVIEHKFTKGMNVIENPLEPYNLIKKYVDIYYKLPETIEKLNNVVTPAKIESKNLNNLTLSEKPRLTKKVIHDYYNCEDEWNQKYLESLKPVTPSENSRRAGVLAVKVGMTSVFDKWGKAIPLTILQLDRCQVVQIKNHHNHQKYTIQIGTGDISAKNWKKPNIGHFLKAGVPYKRHLKEFPVSKENLLPVGYMLSVRHFTPGQIVDIQGITKGKGFAGPVKRWGFKMQPKSHGTSLTHRAHGSTGNRRDPGRVFKNKKMAGRMGGKLRTKEGIKIYKIDAERSLIYVVGSVHGNNGGVVAIKDAIKNAHKNVPFLNYPTFIKKPGVLYATQILMEAPLLDPSEQYIHENAVVKDDDPGKESSTSTTTSMPDDQQLIEKSKFF